MLSSPELPPCMLPALPCAPMEYWQQRLDTCRHAARRVKIALDAADAVLFGDPARRALEIPAAAAKIRACVDGLLAPGEMQDCYRSWVLDETDWWHDGDQDGSDILRVIELLAGLAGMFAVEVDNAENDLVHARFLLTPRSWVDDDLPW